MSAAEAQKRWELENNIQIVEPDQIYRYDPAAQEAEVARKPWLQECVYRNC